MPNGTGDFNNYNNLYRSINIPNPLFQSIAGRYFVGQTGFLSFGCGRNAWGALINPRNSNANVFVNMYTISNYSTSPLNAEIWLNATLPGSSNFSNNVSATNTALIPPPTPQARVAFEQLINGVPVNGVNVFNRIVPPEATIVSEEDGKFILPPGGNFAIFLASPGSETVTASIAFGWWEERIRSNPYC